MQCSAVAVLGVMMALTLSICAEPVGSSPAEEKNDAQYPVVPARFKPVREEAILQLADFVKHGDTLLKERLQASFADLKERLEQGDSLLKERMTEGVAQLKEQRKEGDDRLKEELDDDVAWLKGRLQEGQDRLKEDLQEAMTTFTQEISQLKQAFSDLHNTSKTWTSSAMPGGLKQQVDEVQAELGSTKEKMGTMETELGSTKEKMGTMEMELGTTKELLDTTRQKAESAEQELHRMRQELQTARAEVDSLKAQVEDRLQSKDDSGSVFTRWGRSTCPDITTTVYSGVAGGSWFKHSGGGSNYLCLGMEPQLDNKTSPVGRNYLYGGEYDFPSLNGQDVACSVCRTPHSTSIMMPATLTCPKGWSPQYKGHLMAEANNHAGRTEFVCVDEQKEHTPGGAANDNGALFHYVETKCGALPCPPYVDNVVVTCVVCSL